MKKIATTEVPISDVIAQRWSPRAFDSSYIITEDEIKSLFEAARWAPSCYGDQPWQFVLFNKEDATAWTSVLNCLSVGNQNWAMDASILIVVCANQNFNHNRLLLIRYINYSLICFFVIPFGINFLKYFKNKSSFGR